MRMRCTSIMVYGEPFPGRGILFAVRRYTLHRPSELERMARWLTTYGTRNPLSNLLTKEEAEEMERLGLQGRSHPDQAEGGRMMAWLWLVCSTHGRAWIAERPSPRCLRCEEEAREQLRRLARR